MRTNPINLTLLATFLLLPFMGWAQDNGKEDFMKRKIAQLGISPQQETQLREIHTDVRAFRKEHMKKVSDLREKTKQELLKDNPSKSTLNSYAKEMGDLHKVMNENRIDHLLKLKTILTPEQFSKIASKGFMDEQRPPRHMRKSGAMMKGKAGSCCKEDADNAVNQCCKMDKGVKAPSGE